MRLRGALGVLTRDPRSDRLPGPGVVRRKLRGGSDIRQPVGPAVPRPPCHQKVALEDGGDEGARRRVQVRSGPGGGDHCGIRLQACVDDPGGEGAGPRLNRSGRGLRRGEIHRDGGRGQRGGLDRRPATAAGRAPRPRPACRAPSGRQPDSRRPNRSTLRRRRRPPARRSCREPPRRPQPRRPHCADAAHRGRTWRPPTPPAVPASGHVVEVPECRTTRSSRRGRPECRSGGTTRGPPTDRAGRCGPQARRTPAPPAVSHLPARHRAGPQRPRRGRRHRPRRTDPPRRPARRSPGTPAARGSP
jgi:hypothetical protein